MIARLIRWSIVNRFLVLLATVGVAAWGVYSLQRTPLDALPDLSDVQVIIRTTYPGQAPNIVENQVTYPMTTTMLSVPGAKTVRGYSFFGDSFVYVLFEDGTDLYWARSRVLEYLNQVQGRLPAAAKASLGPDATGVGWIYQYALVDRSGKQDAGQLRALQDWFLKYELKTVPNVAEVASVGGMVRQYQVVLDPDKLAAYGIPHTQVVEALQKANQEAGGSVLELGEAEYMVRASGYLQGLDDFRKVPLMTNAAGVSVRLGDVARIQIGPEMRRGIGELNGEGEATGGVIVMRSGKNALKTIAAVKEKLKTLHAACTLPSKVAPGTAGLFACTLAAGRTSAACLSGTSALAHTVDRPLMRNSVAPAIIVMPSRASNSVTTPPIGAVSLRRGCVRPLLSTSLICASLMPTWRMRWRAPSTSGARSVPCMRRTDRNSSCAAIQMPNMLAPSVGSPLQRRQIQLEPGACR